MVLASDLTSRTQPQSLSQAAHAGFKSIVSDQYLMSLWVQLNDGPLVGYYFPGIAGFAGHRNRWRKQRQTCVSRFSFLVFRCQIIFLGSLLLPLDTTVKCWHALVLLVLLITFATEINKSHVPAVFSPDNKSQKWKRQSPCAIHVVFYL